MEARAWGYTLALISAICLGIANFLYPQASKALGSTNATFFYYIFAIWIAIGWWLPFRESRGYTVFDLKWPLGIALAMFASNLAYGYAVKCFDISTPAIIRALSFFITGLLAVFIQSEYLTLKDWLSFALISAGIVLFGYGR